MPASTLYQPPHTSQQPAEMRTSSTSVVKKKKRVSGALDLHLMLSPTTRQSHQHRPVVLPWWVWCASAPYVEIFKCVSLC